MIKQTAGRDQLGEFAPKFAELKRFALYILSINEQI